MKSTLLAPIQPPSIQRSRRPNGLPYRHRCRRVSQGEEGVCAQVTPMGYVSDIPLPPVVVRIWGYNSERFVDRPTELLPAVG